MDENCYETRCCCKFKRKFSVFLPGRGFTLDGDELTGIDRTFTSPGAVVLRALGDGIVCVGDKSRSEISGTNGASTARNGGW